MRCALIETASRHVINIIEADPATDKPAKGTEIVAIPDGLEVVAGWSYSAARGFIPSVEQRSVEEITSVAIEMEALDFS